MSNCHTVTESTLPAESATPSLSTGLERCPQGHEVPARGYVSPPETLAGSLGTEFFRCRNTFKCGWVGTNVLSRSLRPEPGEYDPREIVYDLMCPQCHSSVVYAPVCCDCLSAAAELGDERCTPCAIECEKQAYETRMLAIVERARHETRAALIRILTGVQP